MAAGKSNRTVFRQFSTFLEYFCSSICGMKHCQKKVTMTQSLLEKEDVILRKNVLSCFQALASWSNHLNEFGGVRTNF